MGTFDIVVSFLICSIFKLTPPFSTKPHLVSAQTNTSTKFTSKSSSKVQYDTKRQNGQAKNTIVAASQNVFPISIVSFPTKRIGSIIAFHVAALVN